MATANCMVCGRQIKDPISIKRGMGPICYARYMAELDKKEQEEEKQLELLPFDDDIICRRTLNGPQFNIPQRFVKHSPSGMEWGYGGSGPADFALNILALFVGLEKAEELYQEFKSRFVATLPFEGGVIKKTDIINWLKEKGIEGR